MNERVRLRDYANGVAESGAVGMLNQRHGEPDTLFVVKEDLEPSPEVRRPALSEDAGNP